MKLNKRITKIAVLAFAALMTSSFGVGCGGFNSAGIKRQDHSSVDVDVDGGGVDATGVTIIPATKTAGIPILSQAYSSLTASLQVATPSAASKTEFEKQLGNLSDTGRANTIGASFAVAYETLGAQLCLDRIAVELPAGAQKDLFGPLNLAAAPANNVNDANLSTVINRLARALWQRNETDAERTILLTAVNSSMADDAANNANKVQEAALFLCTAMLSSSAGMQL